MLVAGTVARASKAYLPTPTSYLGAPTSAAFNFTRSKGGTLMKCYGIAVFVNLLVDFVIKV